MKIVDRLKTQKETLKMAKYFSELDEPKATVFETILGVISAIIIYGIGIGFGIYLFYGFLMQ